MGLLKNEDGGMYGEAVVVLPAFILVWTLVSFVHSGYEEAANISTDVRREHWRHAQGSNTWDGINAYHENVCDGSTSDGVTNDSSVNLATLAGAAVLTPRVLQVARTQPWVYWPGDREFSFGPVSFGPLPGGSWGEYTAFVRNTYHYEKTGSVPRPVIGGSAAVGHHTYGACDENEEEMGTFEFIIWIGTAFLILKGRAGI